MTTTTSSSSRSPTRRPPLGRVSFFLLSQGRVHREGERGGEEVEKPLPQRHLDGGRRSAGAGGGNGADLRIPGRHRRQRREEGKSETAGKGRLGGGS